MILCRGTALRGEQCGEIGVVVAAVVAGAGEKLRQIPVGRHFILAVVEVKLSALQPGNEFIPGHCGNGHLQRGITQRGGYFSGGSLFVGAFGVHQQRHGYGGCIGAKTGGGDCGVEIIRRVGGHLPVRIQGGRGTQGIVCRNAVAHEEGADAAGAVNAQADGLTHGGIVKGGAGGIEAQKVHDGGVSIGEITGGHSPGGGGVGQVTTQKLYLPGLESVGNGIAVFAGI